MKRKRIDEEDVSLDSLLDTMTNVVAILVILLIVTQLGVSDAVKRIAAANPVDPEEVAATIKSIDRKQRRLETLKILADANPEKPENIEFKLKETAQKIEAAQESIKELKEKNEALLLLAAAKKKQEAEQKDLDELNKEIQQRLAEVQKVNAQLADIPVETAGSLKIVSLPNPRPAPRGAKPFLMLIKDQKVYPLDFESFKLKAEQKAVQIIDRAKLNRDPKTGIDAAKFLTLFNRQELRDNFFEVTMKANGATPILVFHPLPKKGVTEKLLTNKAGPFWKSLIAMDSSRFYISFLVWSESFEMYIRTRQVCMSAGLAAGWAPQNTTKPYERALGGKLRFGPPPPPKPKTNTPPPVVDPNKKPLPVDTID